MQNKRGLSAVVTTLIIILLAIVAIGILWVVVKNVVQSGAEQIELGQFTLDLEIKSVQIDGVTAVVTVVVKRNPGQGEFVGMNFIFSDGQNSELQRRDVVLSPLEEKTFIFELLELDVSNLETITVAPIYKLSSGSEKTGNPADMFDVKKGTSVAGTGGVVNKFDELGYTDFGRQEYTISLGGDEDIVKFSKVIIDPLDVHLGQTQTFTAYVSSPYGITEVTTFTELDTGDLTLPLELQPDGSYSASWEVYDTHVTTYWTTFTARDSAGNENSITLTWTDPTSCSTYLDNHGGADQITGDCTLTPGEVNGLDGGDITITNNAQVNLDSNSVFAWNSGFSVSFSSGGKMVIAGGSGKQANLYWADVDGDGYVGTSALSLSGSKRAKDYPTGDDCLDSGGGAAYVYQNVGSIIVDADGDGYSSDGAGTECVGATSEISGRTYYKNTANAWGFLASNDLVSSLECDDTSSVVQLTRTVMTNRDHDDYISGSGSSSQCTSQASSTFDEPTNTGVTYYKNSGGLWLYRATTPAPPGNNDCNDNNVAVYINTNCYTDGDGDTYGAGGVDVQCGTGSCTGGKVTSSNDCCDSDANAKPGQTAWYTTPRTTCGGYDYNCVSGEQKRYTATGGACATCFQDTEIMQCDVNPGTSAAYISAAPACGASGNYVTDDGGLPCSRPYAENCGLVDGCTTVSKTQECH